MLTRSGSALRPPGAEERCWRSVSVHPGAREPRLRLLPEATLGGDLPVVGPGRPETICNILR